MRYSGGCGRDEISSELKDILQIIESESTTDAFTLWFAINILAHLPTAYVGT